MESTLRSKQHSTSHSTKSAAPQPTFTTATTTTAATNTISKSPPLLAPAITATSGSSSTIIQSHSETIDLTTPPRRTRITRACDTCRRKKIKCDVNTTQPCTTCRQYQWNCTFNDTAKKRGPPKGYIESLETRLEKMEHLLQQMQDKKRKRPNSSSALCIKNILADEDDQEHSKQDKDESDDEDHPAVKRNTLSSPSPPPSYKLGTLTTESSLIDSLLHKFFNIHTITMPVIDKSAFFAIYNAKKHNNVSSSDCISATTISQSLVYAMCAYTCYRLSAKDPLFETNKPSRDTAFRYFTDKAADLIKDEYFVSRLATVQALILICAQPVVATDQNRNWVFSGLAVRMAQEFRLHRLATNPPSTIQDEKQLNWYKRIWCAVYNIDRWNAAAMGRPLAIADADCDIALPTLPHSSSDDYHHHVIFIYLTKLSCILGEILRTIYTPQAKYYLHQSPSSSSSSTATTTTGAGAAAVEQLLQRLQCELTRWFDAFSAQDIIPEEKAWPLTVCYYGVTLMLYRPFIDNICNGRYDHIRASENCSEIARKMTSLVRAANKLDLVRFGFIFIGYSIYQGLLIHVYDMFSENLKTAAAGREYVRVTVDECLIPLCDELSDASDIKLIMASTMELLKSEGSKYAQQQQQEQGQQKDEENDQRWRQILGSAGPPLNELGWAGEINWTVWNHSPSMLLQKQ
ncbi:fungal-specific transcription factor domain-containing protein [Zychaea mexicana]|uniref:fungal-specific transcription factor domain-containing protein n=1 Tax=Zychaea mexicana TaxID=64656 RepID=UPI0022FDBE11|nr:fungal-specific transcription factor domain-containing protein [Zychaea mexicana]KAI9488059.1 fungal-specific transcription factor domain-containing protein [Zychaea mexicana]